MKYSETKYVVQMSYGCSHQSSHKKVGHTKLRIKSQLQFLIDLRITKI